MMLAMSSLWKFEEQPRYLVDLVWITMATRAAYYKRKRGLSQCHVLLHCCKIAADARATCPVQVDARLNFLELLQHLVSQHHTVQAQ